MDSHFERSELEEILVQMNEAGNFLVSVLASEDGLPVAAAPQPSPYDPETVAAMVTSVKEFVQQTRTHLDLPVVDEVSIVVGDHSRMICRYFDTTAGAFVLAVIAPPHQSYRRLTTRATREISRVWK